MPCPREKIISQVTPGKDELLAAFEVFDMHGNGALRHAPWQHCGVSSFDTSARPISSTWGGSIDLPMNAAKRKPASAAVKKMIGP